MYVARNKTRIYLKLHSMNKLPKIKNICVASTVNFITFVGTIMSKMPYVFFPGILFINFKFNTFLYDPYCPICVFWWVI